MANHTTKSLFASLSLGLLISSFSAIATTPSSAIPAEQRIDTAEATKRVSAKEYQPSVVDQNGNKKVSSKTVENGKLPQHGELLSKGKSSAEIGKAPALNRHVAKAQYDTDFWIYDSYITLDVDSDYDGYYSAFTLEFDVDTIYQRAAIYAEIYSTTNDVFTLFYTTDIYRISGDNTNDSIVVENSLVSGFPSNEYELMVVIYDADTDEVVAVSDGTDDADLALLSLESENYEYVEPVDVVVVERGGAISIFVLFGLLGVAIRRILKA